MSSVHYLNLFFISCLGFILIVRFLLDYCEPFLPVVLLKLYSHGKLWPENRSAGLANYFDVPKSWFQHMYVFASLYLCFVMVYAVKIYVLGSQLQNEFILSFLDGIAGGRGHRRAEVRSTLSFIAIICFTLHCFRRLYETYCVQIFAAKCKINLIYYFAGYSHYFATVTSIIANAEGFVRGSPVSNLSLEQLSIVNSASIMLFLFSCYQQYRCNVVLANLRKNKVGEVVSQGHFIPEDGWFKHVAAPHMLFESLIYLSMYGILGTRTMLFAAMWVIANQTISARSNLQWYRDKFGTKYPKNRKSILPWIY